MISYKLGEAVTIRTWNSMANEYGLYGNSINTGLLFTLGMRHLCGTTFIPTGKHSNNFFIIEPENRAITANMLVGGGRIV